MVELTQRAEARKAFLLGIASRRAVFRCFDLKCGKVKETPTSKRFDLLAERLFQTPAYPTWVE
jgi:hypothetical protein